MELDPDINIQEEEDKASFLRSAPVVQKTTLIQTTLFRYDGAEMWCRDMLLKCVRNAVNRAVVNANNREVSEEVEACNSIFENETEWEGPESRTDAKARKAFEKVEIALWKQLEDLDIRDRKTEQKAAKKASEEKKKKQAAETA